MNFQTDINNVVSPDLEMVITIIGGTFPSNGSTIIVNNVVPITNLESIKHLDVYVDDAEPTSPAGYSMTVQFCWSSDNITYTSYVLYSNDESLSAITKGAAYIRIKLTMVYGHSNVVVERIVLKGKRDLTETETVFTLTSDEPTILKPSDIYKVYSVTNYTLASTTPHVEVQFRYSNDNKKHWTNWVEMTEANLTATKFDKLRFTYFEFAFTRTVSETIKIFDLCLVGDFVNVSANSKRVNVLGLKPNHHEEYIPYQPYIGASFALPTFNPYDFGKAVKLYDYISEGSMEIYGHKIEYFKSSPDSNGIDVVMHEYQLTNIVKVEHIKSGVPDNQFPDNQIKFSEMDMSLLESFEMHIRKEDFRKAFGIDARPGDGDIVYFSDLNRIYDVKTILPDRTSFFTSTYYRIVMKKHSDRAERRFVNDTEKTLLDLVVHNSLDDLFGAEQQIEETNVTNPMQNKPLTQPVIKRVISPLVDIIDHEIWNSSLTVAENVYKVPIKNKNISTVTYGNVDTVLNVSDNRSITFWFKTDVYNTADTYNLIQNISGSPSIGYTVYLHNGNLTLTINSITYVLPVDMVSSVWYCILINIDQLQQNIEMCLYKRNSLDEKLAVNLNSPHLLLLNRQVFTLTPQSFSSSASMYVGTCNGTVKGHFYITNIKVMSDVIQDNARDVVLNLYKVADANLLIVADCGNPDYFLPNLGNG